MSNSDRFVVFMLDEQRYALRLSAVERIVRTAEMTALPKAPEIVLGIMNLQGRIIPVINMRRRFRLPEREAQLSDPLMIAHTSTRSVVLTADAVMGVVERSEEEVTRAEKILPRMEYVEGVTRCEDGLVLIHDLDRFLSLEETRTLDEALATA